MTEEKASIFMAHLVADPETFCSLRGQPGLQTVLMCKDPFLGDYQKQTCAVGMALGKSITCYVMGGDLNADGYSQYRQIYCGQIYSGSSNLFLNVLDKNAVFVSLYLDEKSCTC